jgi:hypothetical protein
VCLSIAAADRVHLESAKFGALHALTDPLGIIAGPIFESADLSNLTVTVTATPFGCFITSPRPQDRDPRLTRQTGVQVGPLITATDGGVIVGAAYGDLSTEAALPPTDTFHESAELSEPTLIVIGTPIWGLDLTLAFVEQTNTSPLALAIVGILAVVTATDGGELAVTELGALLTYALTTAEAPAFAELRPITVQICFARERLNLTFTDVVDVDSRRSCLAAVSIGDPITAANRLEDLWAGLGPLSADALCVTLETDAHLKAAELSLLAVKISKTGPGQDLTFTDVVERLRCHLSLTVVGVGLSITAADRLEDIVADLRARKTTPTPTLDVAAICLELTKLFGLTVRILQAIAGGLFTERRISEADPSRLPLAIVGIDHSIATADRVELFGARFGQWSTGAPCAGVSLTLTELSLRAAIVVLAALWGLLTCSLTEERHPAGGRLASVAIILTIAAAHGVSDVVTRAGPSQTLARPCADALLQLAKLSHLTIFIDLALADFDVRTGLGRHLRLGL